MTATTGGGEESGSANFGSSVAMAANGTPWLFGGDKNSGAVGAAWVYPAVPS